jgi:replicative DNA helicase
MNEPLVTGIHYDETAEQSVLGAMMESPKALSSCMVILGSDIEVFFRAAHKIIYHHIRELVRDGKAVDPVLVGERIDKDEGLNRIGGGTVLYEMVEKLPTAANADYYAEIVRGRFLYRQLDIGAKQILTLTKEGKPIDETIALSQEAILSVGADGSSEYLTPSDQVNSTYEYYLQFNDASSMVEIPTGFPNTLDPLIGGLHRQEFFLLAGLPSMGKSAFAHNILYHVAVERGLPCVLFCYESNHRMIHTRMVASQTGTHLSDNPQAITSEPVINVLAKIKHSNLIIRDNCPMTIEFAVAEARRLKFEHPDLAIVMFDHIHQMTAEGQHGSRNQELTVISGQLKRLAKQLDVAVVGVAQLSRGVIRRKGENRPQLSDLRDSGSLEQDGDTVVFIHRDDYFSDDDSETSTSFDNPVSLTEIIVRKQKDGMIGVCSYNYHR